MHLLARSQARNFSAALGDTLNQVEGAYSLLVLTPEELYAVRDPRGFRPLVLGRIPGADGNDSWVVASETCAFDLLNAQYVREIEPGEMLRISKAAWNRFISALPRNISTAFSNMSIFPGQTASSSIVP